MTKYWAMRGIDAAGPTPSYHTWLSAGATPDVAGAFAGTLPFGGPLNNIEPMDSWEVTIPASYSYLKQLPTNGPDRSGNGNDLTSTGVVFSDFTTDVAAAGFSGFSGTFAGSGYFQAVNPAELDFDWADAFSISVWFKISGADAGYLVSKSDNPPQIGWGLYMAASGNLQLYLGRADLANNRVATETTGTDWSDGAWHHVVVSYAGNSLSAGITFTVDGADQATGVIYDEQGGTLANAGNFNIGARAGLGLLTGQLDEVVAYNRVLTLAEGVDLYNSGAPVDPQSLTSVPSIVGHWGIGERAPEIWTPQSAGDLCVDLSGISSDGTPTDMLNSEFGTDNPGGSWSTHSAVLDGVDGHILIPHHAELNFLYNSTFTIAAWVKPSSGLSQWVFNKMAPNTDAVTSTKSRGYYLAISGGGQPQFRMSSSTYFGRNVTGTATGSADLGDGGWHFVALTKANTGDISSFKLYVDGSNETLGSTTNTLASFDTSHSYDAAIGAYPENAPATYLGGGQSEVQIYNSELSLSELDALYNSGVPPDVRELDTFVNCVGYWRLGEKLTS